MASHHNLNKSIITTCITKDENACIIYNDFGIYLLFTYSFLKQLQLSLRKGKSQLSS